VRDEDIVVIGGAGHVGLPLAISFANAGVNVTIFDVNLSALEKIALGIFPFKELEGVENLRRALDSKRLNLSNDPQVISHATALITVVGTPVDEHQNPDADAMKDSLIPLLKYLRNDQLVILRSTVFPGVTRSVERFLDRLDLGIQTVAAPERIAEGFAFSELKQIPQIIGTRSPDAFDRASKLFLMITDRAIHCTPEEAELAKLFSNAWRYIKFGIVNEMYSISLGANVNFENVSRLIVDGYPRASDFPKPGFAAGPCLPKDALQLSAFAESGFRMGQAAFFVNENLPNVIVENLRKNYDLENLSVGICGMAFKPENDDPRSSLSYKLRKLLEFHCRSVYCTDPYVQDERLVDLQYVLNECDILVIAAPHHAYRELETLKPVFRIWNG